MSLADKILTGSEKFIVKLGLERVVKVLNFLGNPQKNLKIVHVAGTNGKGSVCAILAGIFSANGLKTGLFTSPHLFSYRERFKIDDVEIPELELDEIVFLVTKAAKDIRTELTEFETLTVAAFYYFAKEKVDILVLETGLGGRLDATNVVKKPLACVITSISEDHKERLGDTVEKIAFEKAGIIKRGSPVFISKDNLGYDVVKKKAAELQVKVINPKPCEVKLLSQENYASYEGKCFEFSLLGEHQGGNLALALSVVESLGYKALGLDAIKHKFRMEYDRARNVIIDCCHNPDGARVLRNFLNNNFPNVPVRFVYGSLKNKDYLKIIKTLLRFGDELYVYEFKGNSLKFEHLPPYIRSRVKRISPSKVNLLLKTGELTVVCGSVYMLGEIFKPR